MSKRVILAVTALAGTVCLTTGMAAAQTVNPTAKSIINSKPGKFPHWFPPVLNQSLGIPLPPFVQGTKPPPVIPRSEVDFNPAGGLATYQPGGPTVTSKNAFFLPLGTNGRTCFSCHQPSSGMSISTRDLQGLYMFSSDKDPVFAPVDGANCPDKPHDHSLLLNKGLFRIFLPVPATRDYEVTVVSDPTGCNTNPTYSRGVNPVTGEKFQILSLYRRPLLSTNLKFVTNLNPVVTGDPLSTDPSATPPADPGTGFPQSGNIMWDGREATLESQAINATLGHAQATKAPTDDQIKQIVAFELGIYSAQSYDLVAGKLTADGATGGAQNLSTIAPDLSNPPPLFIPGASPTGFDLYNSWNSASGARQQSIYRGMQIFNTRRFTISNVAGFNNIPAVGNNAPGTCASCHSVKNDGSDNFRFAQHDIEIGGGATADNGPAPSRDLPLFKFSCNKGAPTGYLGPVVMTNDPGLALITGKCADIGRTTVAPLRALAAHAPYFHDGSARTLKDLVKVYNKRFSIGLTDAESSDLVHFLEAL